MDAQLVSALIGATSALLGAGVGGLATYFSVKKQIVAQQKIEEDRRLDQEKLAESILMTFLFDEMRTNYIQLHSDDHFNKHIHESDIPFQWGYTNLFKFKYGEYDHIKYELLRFSSDYVQDVIALYNSFRLLDNNRNQDIKNLSQDEYKRIKTAYLHFEGIF